MKTTKKVMSVLLAASLGVTALAGCKSKPKEELAAYKDRPNKVSVVYTSNAYGKEWITEIARSYMENHNSDTYIQLTQTTEQGSEVSKISSGISSADLYLIDQSVADLKDKLVSLTDVYDSYAIGEENAENKKKISEKLIPMLANKADPRGLDDYVMPYQSQTAGYGLVYNKTMLDEAFPDGYELPRTTDEWFAMGDALKEVDLASVDEEQDAYLLVCSFGDGNEYLQYTLAPWFAQIVGLENFGQFMEGRYWDGEAYVFDETKPAAYEAYKEELKAYRAIMDKLATKSNGYVHIDSDSITYKYAESVAAGKGFKANKSKVAFQVNGAYFQEEAKLFLDANTKMGMMKIPVASAIINRLSTVNDDATLRLVIDYVDGVTTEKPADVSDDDITAVAEARGMIGVYTSGGMMIPQKAANVKGAKDFLRYLASDEAAVIAAKTLDGMEMLPYGKLVSNEELGFEKSDFLAEVSKWSTMNKTLINTGTYLFPTYTDWDISTTSNHMLSTIFGGKGQATTDLWWEANYNYFKDRWTTIVKDYKLAGGVTTNG